MKKIILAAMAFAAVVSAKAQDINAVLKSVEQNNMELKALLKGNEAADIENKSQKHTRGPLDRIQPILSERNKRYRKFRASHYPGFRLPYPLRSAQESRTTAA